MHVVVTGASGFVGRALTKALLARGDDVMALSRDIAQRSSDSRGPRWLQFDLLGKPDPAPFEGADAVVHLAGESVAGRWTPDKKKKIYDSRVQGTRTVVASIAACARKPKTLVCASASGYYGDRGATPLLESDPPGQDFLAGVCIAWEREAFAAEQHAVRVAALRQGIVLGDGGALKAMLPPFRAGVGGPLGSGAQWWPWIHIEDDVALVLFALDRDIRGPINAVSPDVSTNARFSHALGTALRRPALAYAPKFALRIVLGEFASSVLTSELMLPAKALDAGFVFRHERLEQALLDVIAPGSHRTPSIQLLTQEQLLNAPIERAFRFLSDVRSLEQITPPGMSFRVVTPVPLKRSAVIEHSVKIRGVRLRWKSLISEWQEGHRFVDYALAGPFELWRHEHVFEARGEQTLMRDAVSYSLPFAPISNIALPIARADLARLFAYRRMRLAELIG